MQMAANPFHAFIPLKCYWIDEPIGSSQFQKPNLALRLNTPPAGCGTQCTRARSSVLVGFADSHTVAPRRAFGVFDVNKAAGSRPKGPRDRVPDAGTSIIGKGLRLSQTQP